jgi:hypothetical protein
MIQLIQTQPKQFKLDNQQRLHLTDVPENFQERIEHIHQLLDTLRLKEAA